MVAGEVVREECGEGLRARLAKALEGVGFPLGLEDQLRREELSIWAVGCRKEMMGG